MGVFYVQEDLMIAKKKLYRGVQPDVKNSVKQLAASLCVTADEVAVSFLQAGIQAMTEGNLELEPQPYIYRMTLFPSGERPGWSYSTHALPSEASPLLNYRLQKPQWQFSVTYRVPDNTHKKIREIAAEYLVGVGSLVNYILKWGMQEYLNGHLRLSPRAVTVKQSLVFEGTGMPK